MNYFKHIQCGIAILFIFLISAHFTFSQVEEKKFYQKDYYNKIFNEKSRNELVKINKINIDGNTKFQESRKMLEEVDELKKMSESAQSDKEKSASSKKAGKIEKKAIKLRIKALKLYSKANLAKNKVYKTNLSPLRLTDDSKEAKLGQQLELEATDFFSKAEDKKNIALAYEGMEKVNLMIDANSLERLALTNLETAYGLYLRDDAIIMKYIIAEQKKEEPKKDTTSLRIDDQKNTRDQIVYIIDNSGASATVNQFVPKEEPASAVRKEDELFIKLNLTDDEKTKLNKAYEENRGANELLRDVDEMYIQIDSLRDRAKNATTTTEKEQFKSEAVEKEMFAFGKLINAINTHISVNETKYKIYKNNIEKVKLTGSTLEARRGEQLETEAENNYILSQKKKEVAVRQEFRSEQYTMLMGTNEMLLISLEKIENAISIYMNITPLSGEDIQLVINEDLKPIEEVPTKNKGKADTKKDKPANVDNGQPKSQGNEFNFDVKKTYLLSKDKPDTIKYEPEKGLVFKIQIGVFENLPKNALDILSPAMCEVFNNNPFSRFYLGSFLSLEAAELALDKVQSKLIKDAYIVAFVDGKRTALKTARKLIIDGTLMPVDDYKEMSKEEVEQFKTGKKTTIAGTGKKSKDKEAVKTNKEPVKTGDKETAKVENDVTKKDAKESDKTNQGKTLTKEQQKPELAVSTDIETVPGLFYTVELGIYKETPTVKDVFNLTDLFRELTDSGTIYTTGVFNDLEKATNEQKRIVKLGLKKAKVVSYYEGRQVNLEGTKVQTKTDKETKKSTEIVYRIQIGEFEVPLTNEEFVMKYAEVQKSWKITRLDDKKAGKTFYTIGEFEKESDAIKMEDKLREKGSTGLVVSFKGSEKVDILANESGRLYQIQLGSFKKRLTKGEFDQKFSSIPDTLTINSFVDPKTEMTTYIVGNFPNYKQASDVRNVLKQLGVDCFIITSENKNLVASNNALKDAEKKKIEELKEVEKGKDNKKSQSKIEYRIQIGAFKKNLDKKEIEQQYPNIPNKYKIKETLDDASGMNIYTVGNYKTYEEALELQKKLKEGGASGFVVVYENSKKIPLNGIKEETKTKTEAETATKKEKATKQESKKEKEEKKQAKKKKETTKTKETKEEKKLSAKKEEKKDVPEEKKEVVKKKESVIIDYKIQLASYDKPLSNSEFNEKFSDVSKKYIIEIIVDPASGTNYYTIGSYNKYDDAVDFKSALKRQGIYGFVIAFKDAKKISLYDARKSEK